MTPSPLIHRDVGIKLASVRDGVDFESSAIGTQIIDEHVVLPLFDGIAGVVSTPWTSPDSRS